MQTALSENKVVDTCGQFDFIDTGTHIMSFSSKVMDWYRYITDSTSNTVLMGVITQHDMQQPLIKLCWYFFLLIGLSHYGDVIMDAIASQITSLTVVYSTVYSDADQRKHQSSASLAFVRGIHRGPVNSPHKWPVARKMFPFEDVIMVRA